MAGVASSNEADATTSVDLSMSDSFKDSELEPEAGIQRKPDTLFGSIALHHLIDGKGGSSGESPRTVETEQSKRGVNLATASVGPAFASDRVATGAFPHDLEESAPIGVREVGPERRRPVPQDETPHR